MAIQTGKGYTLEELQNMGAKPIQSGVGYTLEELQGRGATPLDGFSNINKQGQKEKTKGIVGGISNFLGTSNLGMGIAKIDQRPTQEVERSQQALQTQQQKVLETIQKQRREGKDVSRLESALSQSMQGFDIAQEVTDVGTGNLSTGDILGSAGQTALNIGTAGLGAGAGGLAKSAGAGVLGQTAARVGEGAAIGLGFDIAQGAQNGETGAELLKPGAGTAVGALIPFGTALTAALGKRVLGVTTGAGKDILQQATDNPTAVKEAIREYAKNPETKRLLVDRMKSGISDFAAQRNQQFGDTLEALQSRQPGFQGKTEIVDTFKKAVKNFGGKVDDNGALSFGESSLSSTDKRNIVEAFDTVANWKDTSVRGLDTLRQNIDNLMDDFKLDNNPRANVVLGQVNDSLKDFLAKNVEGYDDLLSTYSLQSNTIREVVKELGIGGAGKPSTQLTNILKLFQKDPNVKAKVAEILGEGNADKFLNDLSGAVLSEWLPTNKVGNFARGLGAAGVVGGGVTAGTVASVLGALGISAASVSPRIIGELTTLLGQASQAGAGGVLNRGASQAAADIANQ